jgi:hypothetical protein
MNPGPGGVDCWDATPSRGPIATFLNETAQPRDLNNYAMSGHLWLWTQESPYTIALRFQVPATPTTNQRGIASFGVSNWAANPSFLLQHNGTNVNVLAGPGAGYRTIIPAVQADRWYTVSIRYTMAQNFAYCDGVQVLPPVAVGAGPQAWPQALFLGSGFSWPGRCRIDWCGIWSRDLTAGEHQAIGSDPDAIWTLYPSRTRIRRTVYGRVGSRHARV